MRDVRRHRSRDLVKEAKGGLKGRGRIRLQHRDNSLLLITNVEATAMALQCYVRAQRLWANLLLNYPVVPQNALRPEALCNQQHSEGAEQRSRARVIGMSRCYIEPQT